MAENDDIFQGAASNTVETRLKSLEMRQDELEGRLASISSSKKTTTVNTVFGDGSDGALEVSANQQIDVGRAAVYRMQLSALTINSGATLSFTNPHRNGTTVIIQVDGVAKIMGAISVDGMGSDMSYYKYSDDNCIIVPAKTFFTTCDPQKDDGRPVPYCGFDLGIQEAVIVGQIFRDVVVGSGGFGEFYSGIFSSKGGRGGGALVLVAKTLEFTGTATAKGLDGGCAPGYYCSGRGGGGGSIVFAAETITKNTGSFDVSGGNANLAGCSNCVMPSSRCGYATRGISAVSGSNDGMDGFYAIIKL